MGRYTKCDMHSVAGEQTADRILQSCPVFLSSETTNLLELADKTTKGVQTDDCYDEIIPLKKQIIKTVR